MGNPSAENEVIKTLAVGVSVAFVLSGIFGYFAISFFKRIMQDIKTLFDLIKELKCTEHAERIGYLEGKTNGSGGGKK